MASSDCSPLGPDYLWSTRPSQVARHATSNSLHSMAAMLAAFILSLGNQNLTSLHASSRFCPHTSF